MNLPREASPVARSRSRRTAPLSIGILGWVGLLPWFPARAEITLVRDGHLGPAIDPGAQARVRLAAVEAFLRTKVLTPELAPLHSHRYLRMALSYAEREVE